MIIKKFRVKREGPGDRKYDYRVLLRCDKCNKRFEMFQSSFYLGQKRHPGIHLCRMCSNAREYKKIITGKENKKFKGGIQLTGYRKIYYNGKNQYEHRVMAGKKLGRKIARGEEVHHIDCVKLNNSIDNLFIFNGKKNHRKCHYNMEKLAMSLLNKKIWFNAERGLYSTTPCSDFDAFKKYGSGINLIKISQIIPQDLLKEKKHTTTNRYIYKKGGNRALHIFIMEEIVGRSLYRNEVVHHINGDELDNSINNLYLCNRSEHRAMHESLSGCVAELYRNNIISFNAKSGMYFLK